MKLEISDIEHIAMLARLSLSPQEKTMYAKQLSAVFGYIEMLSEANTDDVPETIQVTGLTDILRDDDVRDCDPETRKKIVAQFPDREEKLLAVKAVFNGGL